MSGVGAAIVGTSTVGVIGAGVSEEHPTNIRVNSVIRANLSTVMRTS